MTSRTTPRPTDTELGVWRTFLRAHAQITRRLEADLLAAHDLLLAEYGVLGQLVDAPGRRLRMAELADRVLLSRSGLTRLVDRLVRAGLVERQAYPDDARGILAVLTDAGMERLLTASPTHLAGIAAYATGRLTPDELAELGRLLSHLVEEGGGVPCHAARVE